MDIIKKIKDLTSERGWSIYQLSYEADIGESTLSNMFTRGTLPSVTTLTKLCTAFGITLSQFFYEHETLIPLSDSEKDLICFFRKLPKEKQQNLIDLIK